MLVQFDEPMIQRIAEAIGVALAGGIVVEAPTDAATAAKQDEAKAELLLIKAALISSAPAPIEGVDAADAAVSGKPVTIGVRASEAIPSAVSADGDAAGAWGDRYGRQMVAMAPRARVGRAVLKITSDVTEKDLIAAGAAGVFRDVYRLTITNTSASPTKVTIRDVAGAGAPEVYYLGAGQTKGFSGSLDGADVQSVAASKWTAQCGSSVADIEICARYVERKA